MERFWNLGKLGKNYQTFKRFGIKKRNIHRKVYNEVLFDMEMFVLTVLGKKRLLFDKVKYIGAVHC